MFESIAHVGGVDVVVFDFDIGEFVADGVVEVSSLVVGEDVSDHEALEEELLGVGEGFDFLVGHCFLVFL